MRKLTAIVLMLALVAGAAFAAGQAEEAADVEAFDPDRQYSITVATFPHVDEAVKSLLPRFNEDYPNIEVEVLSQGFEDHHTAMMTDLAAGEPLPDVVLLEISFIAQFSRAGGFRDLLVEPFNAGQYEDIFVPYKWAQPMTPDGRLVAMPKDIAPASIFYRRDIFEDAGLPSEPEEVAELMTTWEDWLDVARQLTRDTTGDGEPDHWAVAHAGEVANMFVEAHDEGWFDEDGNPNLTNPQFVEGLEMARRIREEGLDADIGAWSTEWFEAIERGTTAMLMHGAWMGGHIRTWMAPETAGNWGVAHLPDGMHANDGGSFFGIPETAEYPEASWEFIKWYTTQADVQAEMFVNNDIFPAVLEAFDDPAFDEPIDFYGGQRARQLWIEVAQNVPDVRVHPSDPIADELFGQAVEEVLLEGRDPLEALEDANEQVRRRM